MPDTAPGTVDAGSGHSVKYAIVYFAYPVATQAICVCCSVIPGLPPLPVAMARNPASAVLVVGVGSSVTGSVQGVVLTEPEFVRAVIRIILPRSKSVSVVVNRSIKDGISLNV